MSYRLPPGWTRLSEYSTPYRAPSIEITMMALNHVLSLSRSNRREVQEPTNGTSNNETETGGAQEPAQGTVAPPSEKIDGEAV